MITINRKGKFAIPKEVNHISFNYDTKKFYIEGIMDISLVFKMNLTFSDGSTNYFLADSEIMSGGTMVEWTISNDRLLKNGQADLQITASNGSGLVFSSEVIKINIHTSVEFLNPDIRESDFCDLSA